MKTKILLFILLISLLGIVQVKADTITIYLASPSQTYNTCQDTNAVDTFIVIKNQYFGSTMWYIDWIPQGSSDTFQFIPPGAGSYLISSVWQTNQYSVLINVFVAPPAHANINLSSSSTGHINATKDTVWMCGGPVNIGAFGIVGSHATYQQWTGPNNFSDGNAGITVSTPGTYVWERGNPCGVTRDTVRVISLPTTLPAWPADTTFCNDTVSLTLDAGAGWLNYSWSNTASTQSIQLATPGTYSVTVSNICTTQSKTVEVYEHWYPLPDLAQFNMATPFCADSVVVLNPAPGFTYDTYQWNWGTGSSNDSSLSISGLTTGTDTYTISVSKGTCTASASEFFEFYEAPAPVKVCVVTVDTSGHIKVVWERDEVVDSYKIYRLIGTSYQLVATVPYSSSTSWYDMNVNPNTSAYRYKVSAVHLTCKNEGPQGHFHGSIKITSSPATSGGVNLTVTDPYIDGSGQYVPSQYYILIDSLNNGNYFIVDSMSAVFNSYLVQSPVVGATYAMGVSLPWACDESKMAISTAKGSGGAKNVGTLSVSNKSSVITGLEKYASKTQINIFPNPSSGIFQIEGEMSQVDIFDQLGRLILSTINTNTIDLTSFGQGMYHAKIQTTENGPSANVKLIVQ